jgi:CheY-like chemotaxis protein
VLLAEDAIVGGHIVLRSAPDLIIVEPQMPYFNGYDFVAALVADEQTRGIPVVFLTADPDVETKAKKLGVAAFLPKPIAAKRVLEVVALFASPVAA